MRHRPAIIWFFASTHEANEVISPSTEAQSKILVKSNCHCREMCRACTHHTVCYCCSVSLLSPVSVHSAGLDSDRCLPACLPVCVHVLFLHNHHHLHRHLSVAPSSEDFEKSRSLNNIAGMTGMAGNTLRLSPVTSPYGSPCPLRRSRSPIPSIL